MTVRTLPLRGRALRALTTSRPDFRPMKVERERWLNPESTGNPHFAKISLPAISMYLAAISEGGAT